MNKIINNMGNIKTNSGIKNIAIGSIISLILSVIFLSIYAIILVKSNVQESTMIPVILVIIACSIMIGSSFCSFRVKRNGIINGISIGAIYIATLYIISSILVTGFQINSKTLLAIVVAIVSGTCGGIVGVNIKK